MGLDRVVLSSNKDDWATPKHILDDANNFMRITFDPCPMIEQPTWVAEDNALDHWKQDGLKIDWAKGHVFVNPPSSVMRRQLWCKKIVEEAKDPERFITVLVASRTDTKWFQRLLNNCQAVFFIKGRLKFSGHTNSAPFPSALFYLGDPRLAQDWLDVWELEGFGVETPVQKKQETKQKTAI